MRYLSALALTLAIGLPAAAQTVLSEVSGNWAGPSNTGFYFTAQLVQNKDRLGLVIWNGNDGAPGTSGSPEFDNREIELGAFATRQDLEVLDSPNGSILQITVEFADEEAEGRSVTQIQRIDNQYTVVGYYHRSSFYNPGGEPYSYDCDVDLWNMVSVDNGTRRQLEPVGFEALNASDWTFGAAFDRGFCTRAE
ncbi:hypothetical protein [Rhodobacter sp. SY28-1]|uniref:hypothetical protein n=1 Tax=Rhodobacter sp. SY28-1 TaxID=2562317 RepID=UPI0010C0D71C|nr:hypothetical protein [Rhodobacter sp. SY28-1]